MNTTIPMGSYVSHDESYFPSLAQVEQWEETYMSLEALQLARWVADKVGDVGLNGPVIAEVPPVPGEGTYMSPNAINLAHALHRIWLIQLRKPIPSQEFPAEKAA